MPICCATCWSFSQKMKPLEIWLRFLLYESREEIGMTLSAVLLYFTMTTNAVKAGERPTLPAHCHIHQTRPLSDPAPITTTIQSKE